MSRVNAPNHHQKDLEDETFERGQNLKLIVSRLTRNL